MEKKIIFITGSSGFLGKFFLESALSKGYKIIDILRLKNKSNKNLNFLRKKYANTYKSIFFKNNSEIEQKLKHEKIDYFINFATLYKNTHNHKDILKFTDSNIEFPTIVLDLVCSKVKKIINFGTMMQHTDGENHTPKNFYASTKSAFEMILNFYTSTYKNIKFYNLKFYESFAEKDQRKKLIPILFSNYRKNIVTKVNSNKLELNIIHVNDLINAIYIILKNNVKSGSYCLCQKNNIKISNLIFKINKILKRKLKIKYLNYKIEKIKKSKLKVLMRWKSDKEIEKKIINMFYNENN